MTRRSFLTGAAAFSLTALSGCGPRHFSRRNAIQAAQYHNQRPDSPLHRSLTAMWEEIERITGGALQVKVSAFDNRIQGSDVAALSLLRKGELQFFTLNAGILASHLPDPGVPALNLQGMPFLFRNTDDVWRFMKSSYSNSISEQLKHYNIYSIPSACFENGFSQITTAGRVIHRVEDVQGMKIRLPTAHWFEELFKALGSIPVECSSGDIIHCLSTGEAEAQENPPDFVLGYEMYKYQKIINITNHVWKGFNQLINLDFWNKLSAEIQTIVSETTLKHVEAQWKSQESSQIEALKTLEAKGMTVNRDVDRQSFKNRLTEVGFYDRLKAACCPSPSSCAEWIELEKITGPM